MCPTCHSGSGRAQSIKQYDSSSDRLSIELQSSSISRPLTSNEEVLLTLFAQLFYWCSP